MIDLEKRGCININLVSPTHFLPGILEALFAAREKGLSVPIVYNTGSYESKETIELLDGVVDIYMPDTKYGENGPGEKYSRAPEYWSNLKRILPEMHDQVGDLKLDEEDKATGGLLVRHLVLPNDAAGSEEVVSFISEEISEYTYLNVMDQYRPCFKAKDYPSIDRAIEEKEYRKVLSAARDVGLRLPHL